MKSLETVAIGNISKSEMHVSNIKCNFNLASISI